MPNCCFGIELAPNRKYELGNVSSLGSEPEGNLKVIRPSALGDKELEAQRR